MMCERMSTILERVLLGPDGDFRSDSTSDANSDHPVTASLPSALEKGPITYVSFAHGLSCVQKACYDSAATDDERQSITRDFAAIKVMAEATERVAT